ncbi:hypothetical protein B0H14DRAFT_3109577 [Mycena olivaceomarginata]|nr:hypothetical protein B0H14DRAFT_3109577 [Mycena olivaceomarginata]
MGTQVAGQEWLDSLRYQLATMVYAAGAAHYHHLPALRSVFKSLLESLTMRMMDKAVWEYWYLTSQSERMADPDIKELRKPWPNPVSRENIMVLTYDAPDALVFDRNPIFWGMGRETFSYTRMTLQDTILNEMEAENWLGVCCEPNCIFVVCNQFPLIAIRYNDARNGTNVIEEEVHALYPTQVLGFLSTVPEDERVNVNGTPVGVALRTLVKQEGADPDAPETLRRARELAGPPEKRAYTRPDFGYVVQWVSEVGKAETLDGLLRHADAFLSPTWERGGLFYPRYDESEDATGNWTRMDSYTGNAAIGYARLNVRDGQRKMWEAPWTPEHLAHTPYVDGVDLSSGVDFLRGVWDADVGAMIVTLRTWDGSSKTISPVFRNLPEGTYGLYINGELFDMHSVTEAGGSIAATVVAGRVELDLVLLQDTSYIFRDRVMYAR